MGNYKNFKNASDEVIEEVFDGFITETYPDFKFASYWKKYPEFDAYLKRVMLSSFVKNPEIQSQLPDIMHDFENFFIGGIKTKLFTQASFPFILKSLKNADSGCSVIEFLPKELEGCFGNSVGDVVQINKRFTSHGNSPKLTPEELRRLYLYHELGHKTLNILNNYDVIRNFEDTIDSALVSKNITNADTTNRHHVFNGFWMIEESLAQEMAEEIAYSVSNKVRPTPVIRMDLGCQVETDHDFYGIFEKPTANFGRTLRGCSNEESSDRQVLHNMIRKALGSNFTLEVISEYNQGSGELYYDLFKILRAMGMVKSEKYASFGLGQSLNINVPKTLAAIENYNLKNRDYRTYPNGGFPKVDFSSWNIPSGMGRR